MIANVNRSLLLAWVLLTFAIASWDAFAGTKASRERINQSNGAVTSDSITQLSGQELWSMNCQRCHNMRSPAMYSDTQWEVIVHHMRVRANITGVDARAIAEFLKSAGPTN
jgi:nitrate/TMAO reductase-like tetraheme cytochrome c subunit